MPIPTNFNTISISVLCVFLGKGGYRTAKLVKSHLLVNYFFNLIHKIVYISEKIPGIVFPEDLI